MDEPWRHTGKSIETESKLVVAAGCDGGGGEWLLTGVGFRFGDDEIFWGYIAVMLHNSERTKNHWIIHFKRVNFYGMWIVSQ